MDARVVDARVVDAFGKVSPRKTQGICADYTSEDAASGHRNSSPFLLERFRLRTSKIIEDYL
jgi:hypothetical protein